MARPLRPEAPGAIHHVYARGNDKRNIFIEPSDWQLYLRLLERVVVRRHWRCLGFCLMPNHVHLLIETPDANLGAGMQTLHGVYAQTFNATHGRVGHLFQGRFGSALIESDGQLWVTSRYIALNPVAAGLCQRPEEWPWSGHAGVLSADPPAWLDVSRLLKYFEAYGGDGLRRYTEFVEDGLTVARLAAATPGR